MTSHLGKLLQARRAVKNFDTSVAVPDDVIARAIEQATLAPSSLNLQHWQFYHVRSDSMVEKMRDFCLQQPPAMTADKFVVVVARPDLVKKNVEDIFDAQIQASNNPDSENHAKMKKLYLHFMPMMHTPIVTEILNCITWVMGLFKPYGQAGTTTTRFYESHTSCAMAAITFMLSMTEQGYDTCPMGGVDRKRIKRLLDCPIHTDITMVIAVGKASKKRPVYGKRTRLPMDRVFKDV